MVVSFDDVVKHLKTVYVNNRTYKQYVSLLHELKDAFVKNYRTINFLYESDSIILYLNSKYDNELVQKSKLGYLMGILVNTEYFVSKTNRIKNIRAYNKYVRRVEEINRNN